MLFLSFQAAFYRIPLSPSSSTFLQMISSGLKSENPGYGFMNCLKHIIRKACQWSKNLDEKWITASRESEANRPVNHHGPFLTGMEGMEGIKVNFDPGRKDNQPISRKSRSKYVAVG